MSRELFAWVMLLAVTALLAWRTMELDEVRERLAPYMAKECAPPEKALRAYPLEGEA